MGILSKCFALLVILTLTAAMGNAPTIINVADASTPSDSQCWSKTYGGTIFTGTEGANSVVQTSDGGYALAGSAQPSTYDANFLLFKTDSSGNQLWSKTYPVSPEPPVASASSVIQTVDGGYALVGQINFYGLGGNSGAPIVFRKTDSSGNLTSSNSWDSDSGIAGPVIIQTSDDGYAIAGETYFSEAWLIKTDASGHMLWNKTFDGADHAVSVVQTSDGGYTLACTTHFYDDGDFLLVKTDSLGNPIWNKTYGAISDGWARSLIKTNDGGYAIAGSTDSFGAGNSDFWLATIDSKGNMQWNKTYGGTGDDNAFSVVQTSDGGYTLVGVTNSFGAGSSDAWLVKTDSVGNQLWNKTYGGKGFDGAFSVVQTIDGGYALAGDTDSFDADYAAWLIKTDALGNSALPPLKLTLEFFLLLAAIFFAVGIILIVLFRRKHRSPLPVGSPEGNGLKSSVRGC
jgi:hypothetical protein